MTMTRKRGGFEMTIPYLPSVAYSDGDVIVVGSMPMVAIGDNPQAPSLPIYQGNLAVSGGIYLMAADGAYQVGTYVYWNPTAQQVGDSGTFAFGWIVAGPQGRIDDGGPTGAASLCYVLHAPIGVGSIFTIGAVANDTITNTAAETAFATTAVIPSGFLEVGDVIHVRLVTEVTAQNGVNTHLVKLKILTATGVFTAIFATAAVNAPAGDVCIIECDLVFTAVGAVGSFYAVGQQTFGVQGTATLSPFALAATAIATNEAITIEATSTASAASAGNVNQLLLLDARLGRK